jgi:nicotinate dehydrogenase subunit A
MPSCNAVLCAHDTIWESEYHLGLAFPAYLPPAFLEPHSMSTTLTVNGKPHTVQAAPETPLLYVLRNELSLNGPRFGCGLGQCGACTVHVGDQAVRSCLVAVGTVKEPVTTLEGLGTPEHPHKLQTAFVTEQAAQCGYCSNGMIMQAAALLQRVPHPDETQIREAMEGNLCRCGTHMRILRAVRRAGGVA